MESSIDRELRQGLEKKLRDWYAPILEGRTNDKEQKEESSEGSLAEIRIAALSAISQCLADAIKNASEKGQESDELKSLTDRAVELAGELSGICRAYAESRAISPADEIQDQATTDVMDETLIEPNAAEEWLASGVAEPRVPKESVLIEQPAPVLQVEESISSTIPAKRPEPMRRTDVPPKNQLIIHLNDLQNAISWGKEKEATKARQRVLKMSSYFSERDLKEKIRQTEWRGREMKRIRADLDMLIRQNGILHEETICFWDRLRKGKMKSFQYVIKPSIKKELVFRFGSLLRTNPPESSTVADFIRKATSAYGNLASQLPQLRDAHQTRIPAVDPGLDHRIPSLQPSSRWTLYIDETGSRFGDEEGKEGRVVGLVFPEETELPPLPQGFHASTAAPAEVLHRMNELLSTPCGILGLGIDDLHQMTQEHWLACVLEVVNWVWRLLPLPEKAVQPSVTLNVFIENKGTYDASKDLEWLQTGLAIAWDKESPHRNKMIQLGKLDFVPKDTDLIGWVDLVAYCWGASKKEINEGLRQSRLTGSCLLKGVRELLPIWAKAINGKMVEANEWQMLTEQKDAERPGSLTEMALQHLNQTCRQTPENWQRYVDVMNDYLATKKYDLSVVETQANWLAGMEGIRMTPEMRFFWKMAELARFNHTGEITTQAMQHTKAELIDLSEKVGLLLPHARCHAMLRVAVADANAFDFKAAEERLASWNPEAGGSLMGSAIWDGKILSSLGQYAAFQGQPERALPLFDQALEKFKLLEQVDPVEAARQHSQTSTYAAIAAMDAVGLGADERNTRMESAIGTTVLNAANELGGDASPGNRYLHHLLVRYLAMYGSKDQQGVYRRTASTWLLPEIGMGAGHPWPLIQYYRWELTKDRKLIDSIFDYCWGREQGATVKLIGMTLGIASGILSANGGSVSDVLQDLKAAMPKAAEQIDRLVNSDGLSGLDLLKRVLPFNYR